MKTRLIICFLTFLSTSAAAAPAAAGPYNYQRLLLGTYFEITVDEPLLEKKVADKAVSAILSRVDEIDKVLSHYRPDSEISRFNVLEEDNKTVPISPDMLKVLLKAKEVYNLSQGAFDPTLLPLSNFWKEVRAKQHPPSREEVEKIRQFTGFGQVTVDAARSVLSATKKEIMLDLDGLAKGYVIDEAAHILKSYGISNALINVGGDLMAMGHPRGKSKWRIGIQHPRKKGRLMGSFECNECAVATSGDYENFTLVAGKRISHIIDPISGYPANQGVLSATVISKSAMEANAWAVALSVLGPDRSKSLLKYLNRVSLKALMVVKKKRYNAQLYATPGLLKEIKDLRI